MDKCVFIHTNERQWLGALVAEYSFRRNSPHADKFDVQFIHTRDYPYLSEREGQVLLRGGIYLLQWRSLIFRITYAYSYTRYLWHLYGRYCRYC